MAAFLIVGLGNPNKECETAFGLQVSVLQLETATNNLQNRLHKYYVYTIAQIKLSFCGIASPQCEIHWLYVNKELLAAQPQLWAMAETVIHSEMKSYSLML